MSEIEKFFKSHSSFSGINTFVSEKIAIPIPTGDEYGRVCDFLSEWKIKWASGEKLEEYAPVLTARSHLLYFRGGLRIIQEPPDEDAQRGGWKTMTLDELIHLAPKQ